MRKAALLFLSSVSMLALCHPSRADDQPSVALTHTDGRLADDAAKLDEAEPALTHIRVVQFSPLKRYTIVCPVGHPVVITFPTSEQIYRTPESGKVSPEKEVDGGSWEGPKPADVKDAPMLNILPLWPDAVGESTMTVVTMDANHEQKIYPFHLIAIANDPGVLKRPDITLNLRFSGNEAAIAVRKPTPVFGPAQPRPAFNVQALKTQQAAVEQLRTDSFKGADQTCHYHGQGASRILMPLCPMDNGQWTAMRFPGLTRKPAIYIASGKDWKDERLAPQQANGDLVVVREIAARFRLRLGLETFDIVNDAYDPAGRPSPSGTLSPNVTREILHAKAPPATVSGDGVAPVQAPEPAPAPFAMPDQFPRMSAPPMQPVGPMQARIAQ